MGISRSTSRARWAWRMSRSTRPALARLTSASGFAGGEVDDLVHVQALVRFAPAQDGNVDHGWFSFWGQDGFRAGGRANSSRAQVGVRFAQAEGSGGCACSPVSRS